MFIRRIDIRDFGLFRQSSLIDLHQNINIIGGLNRAGKSTLKTVLASLGYGYQNNEQTPAAKKQYQIDAVLIDVKSAKYHLDITGFGKPHLYKNEEKKEISIQKLFKNIDRFTYQNLFVITLDKLISNPAHLNEKEISKLQAILLGAGLNDFRKLPLLRSDLLQSATRIGGKFGKVDVAEFKPYNKQIKRGITLQKTAQQDLSTFNKLKEEKKSLVIKKEETQAKINKLNQKISLLDLLDINYELLDEYLILQENLSGEKASNILNYPAQTIEKIKKSDLELITIEQEIEEITTKIKADVSSLDNESLVKFTDELNSINELTKQKDVYQERINLFNKQEERILDKKATIDKSLDDLFITSPEYDQIKEIRCNKQVQAIIKKLINNIKDYKIKNNNIEEEIRVLEKEIDLKDNQELVFASKQITFYIAIFIIIASIFGTILWTDTFIWILLSGVLLLGIDRLLIYRQNVKVEKLAQSLAEEKNNLQIRLIRLKEESQTVKNELRDFEKQAHAYQDQLYLVEKSSLASLAEDCQEIKYLQEMITDWQAEYNNQLSRNKEIKKYLTRVVNLANKFQDLIYELYLPDIDELFEYPKYLDQLDLINNLVVLADRLISLKEEKKSKKIKLEQLINIDEQLSKEIGLSSKKIIDDYNRLNKLNDRFKQIESQIKQSLKKKTINLAKLLETFAGYDKNSLSETIKKAQASKDKFSQELITIIEKIENKKIKLAELSTDQNLYKSKQLIDEARADLRPLAEEYAVKKTTAFLLKKMEEKFLEKAYTELLTGAKNLFKNITANHYHDIIPDDDLSNAKFSLIDREGDSYQSLNMLSRGTEEQLFLAVRLSRIQEVETKLPVIIDDSLVNFDYQHLQRVVDELISLAKTNQLFVLTCHPTLIKLFNKKTARINNWLLKKGKFTKTKYHNLIEEIT